VRITDDVARCQGHNRCHAIAPDLFEIDDLGYAKAATRDHMSTIDEHAARLAEANCPEHAIRLDP
jgi:ferredoxin